MLQEQQEKELKRFTLKSEYGAAMLTKQLPKIKIRSYYELPEVFACFCIRSAKYN